MAGTVRGALDAIGRLEGWADEIEGSEPEFAEVGQAVAPILAEIERAIGEVHARVGEVLYPEGEPQSRVVLFEGERLRFNRTTMLLEPIEDEDPASVELRVEPADAENPGDGAIGGDTDGPAEEEPPPPAGEIPPVEEEISPGTEGPAPGGGDGGAEIPPGEEIVPGASRARRSTPLGRSRA